MYQDKHIDQQDGLVTSMETETAPSGEQPPEQEERGYEDQETSDQGLESVQEVEHEHSLLEQEMAQPDEIDTPPQGELELVDALRDQPDDEIPSSAPAEQPERETVVVTFEQPGTVDE